MVFPVTRREVGMRPNAKEEGNGNVEECSRKDEDSLRELCDCRGVDDGVQTRLKSEFCVSV